MGEIFRGNCFSYWFFASLKRPIASTEMKNSLLPRFHWKRKSHNKIRNEI